MSALQIRVVSPLRLACGFALCRQLIVHRGDGVARSTPSSCRLVLRISHWKCAEKTGQLDGAAPCVWVQDVILVERVGRAEEGRVVLRWVVCHEIRGQSAHGMA